MPKPKDKTMLNSGRAQLPLRAKRNARANANLRGKVHKFSISRAML